MTQKLKVEKIPRIHKEKKESLDFTAGAGQLMVDVFQTDKEFVVRAPVAAVDVEDLEVVIDDEMLIIKGQRQEEEKITKDDYFYQECFWGSFERQVILPEDIDKNKLKATLQNGVLTIKAIRVKKIKKKKLDIESDE